MSEPTAEVIATPAPESTGGGDAIESAIASSIADIRTDAPADRDDPAGDPAKVAAPAADATAIPPAKIELGEFDAMIEAEMGAGHAAKRDNRVPHSRTVKIIENAKKKWQADHEAALKPHTERTAALEAQLAEVAKVEQLILGDDAKFMNWLAEVNPAYKRYIGQAAAVPAASLATEKPQPDVNLPDGTRTYSQAGLDKLLEWQTRQAEDRITKRFEPIEAAHKQQRMIEAAMPRVQAQMSAAEKWPMFNENKADILKALQANQQIDLRDAYQQVVFPKMIADRTKMREEIIAELNTRPHTTATPSTTPRTPETAGPRDMEDIIRDAIRKKT